MRILIPTIDYPPIEGGISTVAVQVSRELAARGHEVTVVAPHFPGMEGFDAAEPVEVIRFKGYGLGWLRFFPFWLKAWPMTRNTDLILAINIAYGGLLGLHAWRRRHVPYVTFAYAYEFLKFAQVPFIGKRLLKAYNHSRSAIAISAFTGAKLRAFGVDESRIATILPGAPAASNVAEAQLADVENRFVLEGRRVILSVGRLVPRKNHVALVRALPRIRERIPDATLVIAGRGPCVSEISRTARELGIREEVLLPGYVDDNDLAALYQRCEVFALPAKEAGGGQVEGFGLVCAEASSYGKPVVAGRSGGLTDAVIDGETGMLIDPDDENALTEAIIRLMEDSALAAKLGEAGRKRIHDELNWAVFTDKLLSIVSNHGDSGKT